MPTEYYCRGCGKQLSEDERPCKSCGSTGRRIELTLHEKIAISDSSKWYKPAPVKDSVTSLYFPSGNKILQDRELDSSIDNYIDVFGDYIKEEDKKELTSSDENVRNSNKNRNVLKYSTIHTLHYLSLAIFAGIGITLFYLILTSITIDNWSINPLGIISSFIVCIVVFLITVHLKTKEVLLKPILGAHDYL